MSKHWYTEEEIDRNFKKLNILSRLVWVQLKAKKKEREKWKKEKIVTNENGRKKEQEKTTDERTQAERNAKREGIPKLG